RPRWSTCGIGVMLLPMRNLCLIGMASLGLISSAQAFEANGLTDARIAQALENARAIHRNNPKLFGFAAEELVAEIAGKALGRQCHLSPNRNDPLRDIICPGPIPRRPIQIQVKSGTSATTIGRICYALQTGRYKGARVVLADDTYAGVFLRCGSLIDARS